MYKIQFFMCILFSLFLASSCKEDKKIPSEESILIDGTRAPLLGIDMTEAPSESDNGNYLSAEVNQPVTLAYEGIEKNTITWEIDGETVTTGDQFSIIHQWESPGMKTVKAILENGEERTAFVRVNVASATSTIENDAESIQETGATSDPGTTSSSYPVKSDRDKDGVLDDNDNCPDQKGDKNNKGCPWPDRDGDGVPDYKDNCPDEIGDKKYNGCNPAPTDKDGDGIEDKKDKCPDVPGVEEHKGCPPPPKDSDGDGINDNEDACPKEKGTKQYNGCPPPDSDGDGIPDPADKCPSEKGTKENNGCPPAWKPVSTGIVGKISSLAALDDEKEKIKTGFISIKPVKNLIIHEAKIISSGDGKISFTLEGEGIKRGITIVKSLNTGINTIRFNDFKNNVLKAGKVYTLSYEGGDSIEVTNIKNAYISGTSNEDISISGKTIFFDVVYKY